MNPRKNNFMQSRNPNSSTLNVPFVTPTHFDDPHYIPPQPQPQEPPKPEPEPIVPTPEEAEKESSEKVIRRYFRLAVTFAVLMVIGIAVGVIGVVYAFSTRDQLARANDALASNNEIISAIEKASGATITSPETIPVFETTHGYLYLDNWHIKIKVPETLTAVSYILNENYRPSICFNAYQKGIEHFPVFADIAKNTGGMGCLLRVESSEGYTYPDGTSFGDHVYSYKGYNYFYTPPEETFSTDAAEQNLESASVQLIKSMLSSENISSYE